MIQRIKMNFKVQHIWPLGAGGSGSYRNYHIVNAARKEKNQSKGEAFMDRNLYSKVVTGVGATPWPSTSSSDTIYSLWIGV